MVALHGQFQKKSQLLRSRILAPALSFHASRVSYNSNTLIYSTDAKLPTVLQINRESRAQGLKFYEILAISMIKIERDEAPGMVDWQVKWHNEEVNDQHEVEFKEFENPKDASYAGDSGRPYHQFRTYINYAADTLYFNDHHITVDPRNLTLIGIRFGRFQFNERERRLDGIKRFLSPIGENAIAQQKIQNLAFRSTKHWKKVLRKHSLAPVLMRLKSLQNFTLVLEDEYDSCSDEPHKPAKYFSDAALEKSRASREKRLSNAVSRIDEGFRSWEGVREFADVPEGSTAMKLNFSITGVVRE